MNAIYFFCNKIYFKIVRILRTILLNLNCEGMKVNLIKKKTIHDFVIGHSNGRKDFDKWLKLILVADWNSPKDIQVLFPSADLLGNGVNRAVFNIGGNKFRLIASYYFGMKSVRLYIKWIGTHSEYDELCKDGKQYFINFK